MTTSRQDGALNRLDEADAPGAGSARAGPANLRPRHGLAARPDLGAFLVALGALDGAALADAVARAEAIGAPLGEVLTRGGFAHPRDVARARALQAGTRFVDLASEPPDPLAAEGVDLELCLALCVVPWRRVGGARVWVVADPEAVWADGRLGFEEIAVAAGPEIDAAIERQFAAALAARARDAVIARRPDLSAAEPAPSWQHVALWATLAAAGLAAWVSFSHFLLALNVALLAIFGPLVLLRLAILALGASGLSSPRRNRPARLEESDLPKVTVIAALRREAEMAASLVAALGDLRYPRERLEALIAIEADDVETAVALQRLDLPPHIRIVTTPPGGPRTKPRALNHALAFAEGEIIGVYDAEDRPEPDQILKLARAFAAAPQEVAAIQARLAFYNPTASWIARQFQIEYAVWFEMLLPGLARLGLPIPLGGTSVFFRREALERLGGWDPHNVTEDADLGIRLARFGMRCGLVDSTTREEAVHRLWPWVRQRSRWIKGYMQTWIVHMRAPRALWRDLGARGFFGFQLVIAGSIATHLAHPLYWLVYLATFGVLTGVGPDALRLANQSFLIGGNGVVIATGAVALVKRGEARALGACLAMPLYWPIASLAAGLAAWRLWRDPHRWDKTDHGVSLEAQEFQADAARALTRRH